MKATGVVVEYNPFHNGHRYHLEKAREEGTGEVVIAAMSGDFLQRGEPAIVNKWKRAEMALRSGVDIVVELPAYYSNQSAEIFARGAVGILGAMGVSDLVFGSESGEIEKLKNIASLEENEEFQSYLKEELGRGSSYPTSFAAAIEKITGEKGYMTPNDILGTEYVRSINKLGLDIKPIAIKREGTGYHSHDVSGDIASATAIRRMLGGEMGKIKNLVPEPVYEILTNEFQNGRCAWLYEFYPILRHEIILHKDSLGDIQDIEAGFENRLYESALKNREFEKFYEDIMTKRYTNARIQRILTHILLGITVKITEEAKKGVPYVRVIGFNKNGGRYLKGIRDKGGIEVFTTLKNVSKKLSGREKELLDFNERCSMIYTVIKEYEERKTPIIMR
ncbi:nucleotidyltransferase [uncultured Ilyobacter sp.]|uniref:nucleotidyltransferase n=1 Tax=uncultured Ilyobacter sp. TaxID=544433 RepID=UPI0029C72835|nr:nucleotidyltransferase [uncultured Ilyobacter sp.]